MEDIFIDPDISKAKTITTEFYTSEDLFRLAKEQFFSPSWQFIGDIDKVKESNSVFPFTLLEDFLDEPLLLSRDADDIVYCLSNVCTHRGNILAGEPCKTKQLTCKYHGRRFSLNGKFVSMPEFKEVKNFPTTADNLHQLPLFKWGKLLFTNLIPGIQAEDFFSDIQNRLRWFPVDKLEAMPRLSRDYEVNANWALYCENYLEGFHIPFVHAGLNEVLDFSKYSTEIFRYSNLQIGFAKEGEASFELPSDSPDFGKNVAGYYFWAFPNLMLNFYPWGVSVNVVKPISVNKTRISFYTYVCDRSKLDKGAGKGLDEVELEDEAVVESVQKGIRSRFYDHGRYSVTREQGTHHFHMLISQFLKR